MENKKKGFWVWGLIIAIIAIIVIIVVAVFADSNGGVTDAGVQLKNSEMTCEYQDILDDWYVEITGQIENTTVFDYEYVAIEFSLYDASGNYLDTVLDLTDYLKAGDVWTFEASGFFDKEVVDYELVEITYW